MTGKVRLYSKSNRMIRSLFFNSKEDVKNILERWRDFYGERMEDGWIQIAPYIPEARVINMKSPEFINRQRIVINRPKEDIQMPDYVIDQGLRHETWHHKLYYKNEK